MGKCKYCGEKAGIFSSAHKECEEKHNRGLTDFESDLRRYFNIGLTASNVSSKINRYRQDNFMSDDDVTMIFDKVIREYTAGLRRPYSPQSMHLVDDLVNALGVKYQLISEKGGLDEFTKKLMRGFMVDYFTDKLPLATAQQRCASVLKRFPMAQSQIDDAYWHVLDRAATNFLADDNLSDHEQQKIQDYVHALSLSLNNIPAQYQAGDISKISQVALLKALQQGVVPTTNFSAPIILGKKETVLWAYNGVNLYQEKITREYVGRSGGFSFKVMKGVYYRTGRMKGHPVERSSMELQGHGTLYVTNKNLIFYSQTKGIKIPFNKIVGITPYSDGIEVHKDGANVKRITMQGFDPWFLMNVLSHISNI